MHIKNSKQELVSWGKNTVKRLPVWQQENVLTTVGVNINIYEASNEDDKCSIYIKKINSVLQILVHLKIDKYWYLVLVHTDFYCIFSSCHQTFGP